MSFSLFIARRLSLSTKASSNTGIITAITGIALSMTVMIVSIAIMTGFRKEIVQKVTGFDSQISIGINPDTSGNTLVSNKDIEPIKTILPHGVTYSLTGRQPVIIKTKDNFSGSVIKGVDGEYDMSFLKSNLVEGVTPDYKSDSTLYDIVLSRTLAQSVGLTLGDKVDTYFLNDGGGYRIRKLKIAGLFDTHFSEYDRNMIFGSLDMLRQVAGIPDSCATIIEINGLTDDKLIDEAENIIVSEYLDRLFSGQSDRHYTVLNIHKTAALFFNWLALLDTNVAVILTLMSLLTILTLVSSLFILILRRVKMIGVLKALGASSRQIRHVFIILSLKVLAYGLIIGNILGLCIVYIQKITGVVPLDPEAYYLDHVPVEIQWPTIMLLNIAVVILSFTMLLLPSTVISTISPSRTIRYE